MQQCCATQAVCAPIDGITALDFSRLLGCALCCSPAGVEASVGLAHHSVKRNHETKKSNKNLDKYLLSKIPLYFSNLAFNFIFFFLKNYFSLYCDKFSARLNHSANSQKVKLLNLSQESVNNENSVLQIIISVSFENSSADGVKTTTRWNITGKS